MPTHSALWWSTATKTATWPSSVQVVVMSVPHIVSTWSGMIVPSWLRGPRGEPARAGASRSCWPISRSTRRNDVRTPRRRSRAQTLRCPSPWKGLSASTARIATTSSASGIGPAGPRRRGGSDASGCRYRYRVARESRQTRQTRAVPYGLPLLGETAALIAAASAAPKGRDHAPPAG